MIIGSDLVLGVANAADAAKQREAMAKLQKLNTDRSAATTHADISARPEDTADASSRWSAEVRNAAVPHARMQTVGHAPRVREPEASSKEAEAYTQFEAVLLQNMVEGMMPKDSDAMFGSGTAGNMWKSMLAEKIAEQIARSGTLGIAKQIAAGQNALAAARAASDMKVGDA